VLLGQARRVVRVARGAVRALAGVLALVLAPSALPAASPPRVLIVGPLDGYGALVAGVSEGLGAAGFGSAADVEVEVRSVQSVEEARTAIAGAVARGLDAVVTVFGQATQAARDAAAGVPVVFCPVADPVAAKLVASAEAPGGGLTGVASADAEASRRRLRLFREVLPTLRRLGVLFDPGFPPDRIQLANLEQVAPSLGLTIVKREITEVDDAVRTLAALDPAQVDAVFLLREAWLRRSGRELGRAAVERHLPIVVGDPDLADLPGVVAAVGPNQAGMGRIAGTMVAKILGGAKPGALPVEHPPFDLVVNLKSAADLGLTVPEGALSRAAHVIR
jgi:putative tryptophan/tyrosine transport system substrate-binding protein